MADFVAVLRKTIDGLSDPTPEMREKVYEKARSTIAAKLAAINPPPSAAVVDRQKQAIEDAIGRVEKEYAAAAPLPEPEEDEDPLRQLESVFASIERAKSEPQAPSPEVKIEARSDNWPRATPAAPLAPIVQKPILPDPEPVEPEEIAPAVEPGENTSTQPVASTDDDFVEPKSPPPLPRYMPAAGTEPDEVRPAPETFRMPGSPPERKRSYAGLIAALVALLVIAGGGYGIWLNKDAFASLFGSSTEVASTPEENTPQEAQPDGTAAVSPGTETTPAAPEAAQPDPKLTQRLTEDGSEVDPGPAGGEAGIGEGTSVSSATQPSTPEGQPSAAQGNTPAAAPVEQPAVAVGQKAIFYEERTNVAQGSAENGSVVWSTVQESPGGDLPPEPAIRAEATIPGKDLQLRLTIRRNADDTLPASHIIEVIFLTPDGFEGGGIDNILRIALKGSEQDAGSPLMGIPAKIADGFFLVALNESPAEMNNNLTLLRRQSWIDLPVVYKSGRRALFTLEKGIPGEKIFTDALNAWQAASNGQASGG